MREQKHIKRAHKDVKEIRKAKIKARQNKQEQSQKKLYMVLGVVFLLIFLSAFTVPVSYIPFLNKIVHSFGLPDEIARKLTLLDLSLNSLGVETSSMKAAFENKEIVDDTANPVLYTRRYEPETSRLIDARKSYYYEFERTHRRPDEISGIYQDGKEVDTPALEQGQVGGVRSLPNEDYLLDDSYVPSNGEERTEKSRKNLNSRESGIDSGSTFGTARRGESYTVGDAAGVDGAQADKRKTRKSFDKDNDKDNTAMPGFVSSVYVNNVVAKATNGGQEQATTQTVDINNSRMVKPLLKGGTFGVSRKETPVETFVGNSDFSKNLSNLRSFGGHDVLGFYIADDVPENTGRGTFQKFGTSGEDAINSYFYSHVAVGRKYRASAKYLAELAFSGEKANNEELLIARGQKEDRAPSAAEGMSPVTMMKSAEQKMKECNKARQEYEESTKELREEFTSFRKQLISLSQETHKGAPGACRKNFIQINWFDGTPFIQMFDWGNNLAQQRMNWNSYIDTLRDKCEELDQKAKPYAQGCNMEFSRDPNKDNCASLLSLKVNPPTKDQGDQPCLPANRPCNCESHIIWANLTYSPTFNGCNSKEECLNAINDLFNAIAENEILTPNSEFAF